MIDVLGLRHSVRVQEDGVIVLDIYLLLGEFEARQHTQRNVWIYGKFGNTVCKHEGCIMTGVAVDQVTGFHVQDAAEESHEH